MKYTHDPDKTIATAQSVTQAIILLKKSFNYLEIYSIWDYGSYHFVARKNRLV